MLQPTGLGGVSKARTGLFGARTACKRSTARRTAYYRPPRKSTLWIGHMEMPDAMRRQRTTRQPASHGGHHSTSLDSHTRRSAEEPLLDQDSNASCPTNIYYINMSLGRSRHERERHAKRHHFMHQNCGLAIVADTRSTREPRGSNGPVLPNAHLAMTYALLGDPIRTSRLALDVHMHMADMRTRLGVPR